MTAKPNVLVIMSDQHHPRYMGCAGHGVLRTPVLDALAARGTRFEHAYCASPLCGPSRMAFMTGQLPSSNGVLDNHKQLDSDTLTFAHLFGKAGYETVLAGRMHFNGPDQRHGFHRRIISDITHVVYQPTSKMMGELLDNGPWYTGPQVRSIDRSGPGQCSYEQYDQQVARVTADWLRSRKDDRPFMLTAGFVLPHAPFVCSEADFAYYDKLVTEDDLPEWDENLHPYNRLFAEKSGLLGEPRVSKQAQRRARVAYLGMCASVDRQVGQILDALRESGQMDNTIVVYVSDHGEQLGEHGLWWKHTFYEGSIGVPMILAGPGVPQGKVVSQNVSLLSLGQTLLDMTGCGPNPTSEGGSFRCLLDGDAATAATWNDTVLAENLWYSSPRCLARMIKRGPWKLNHYHDQPVELFNLEADPQETRNLADDGAYQQKVRELSAALLAGWDHDAIMAKQARFEQGLGMIQDARWKSDMPEPDEPWLKGLKVVNEVDTSR